MHVLSIILNEYDGDVDAYNRDVYGIKEEDCPECTGQYIDTNNICKQCGQNFNYERPDNN